MHLHQPRRCPAILRDHFHPVVRDARVTQRGQVIQGTQWSHTEDGVTTADISHHLVHLSGAVTKRDPLTIARPATRAEIGTVAEERREDTVLCVKERQVMVNRYLTARGAGAKGDRVHQAFELLAVEVHAGGDPIKAEAEQDLNRVRVHGVEGDVADEKRERSVADSGRPLRKLRAQPAQTFEAPEASHQDLLRSKTEKERLDPLLARLLHARQSQRPAHAGDRKVARCRLQPHEVEEVEGDAPGSGIQRATHLLGSAAKNDEGVLERWHGFGDCSLCLCTGGVRERVPGIRADRAWGVCTRRDDLHVLRAIQGPDHR